MTKKDVLELKKRFKKNECTFTRISGCYVNAHQEIVLKFGETFLNLEDEEFYKYLEIAKKTLSGTIGNNLLELEFPLAEENSGGRQQFLMGLRESRLKNEELLETFYQLIIDSYDHVGNFLILLFHDAYDVITKTNDNSKLDESEEVYDYLLCSICPVSLTKPGLGYLEDENKIGARIRDWVVEVPEAGFIFPAFTERSSDIHSIVYYTKNPKDPHPEFMEAGLGCDAKKTAAEQKETFECIIKNALVGHENPQKDFLTEIHQTLNDKVEEHNAVHEEEEDPVLLTSKTIQEVLQESGVPEEITAIIEKSYEEEFADTPPLATSLIDAKAVAANVQKKKEKELEQQVVSLKQQLVEKSLEVEEVNDEDGERSVKTYDVILRVKPEKANQIKSQIIDGQKYLVIPMNEDEYANVNGVSTIV